MYSSSFFLSLYSYNSSVFLQLLSSEFGSLIIPQHEPHGKHFSSVVSECVFIGPLPSNGCLSMIESVTPGMCVPSRCLSMVICVTICTYHKPLVKFHMKFNTTDIWITLVGSRIWSLLAWGHFPLDSVRSLLNCQIMHYFVEIWISLILSTTLYFADIPFISLFFVSCCVLFVIIVLPTTQQIRNK
jgi:hypothetical protein